MDRYHPNVNNDDDAIQSAFQKYKTNGYFAWGDYSINVKKINPKTERYKIIAKIVSDGTGKVIVKRRK